MTQLLISTSMFPIDLPSRVAVVTGASRRRGIGAAVCRALAAQGTDGATGRVEATATADRIR